MAFAIAAIGSLLAFAMWDSYHEQRRFAEQSAVNLAAALSEEIRQEIQSLDSSLQAAVDGWRNDRVASLDPELRKLVLFDRSASRPSAGSIYIIDASGRIALEAGQDRHRAVTLSDRSYFRAHRDQIEAGLVISEPIQSRLDGQWLIALTRRLDNPDGSFGGIVIASISLSHFRAMYERLSVGRAGAISLVKFDGSIVTRSPFIGDHVGRSFAPALPGSVLASTAGTYDAVSPIDGVERIYAYRRIGALPYVQLVALSKSEVFAPWWRKMLLIAAGFAGLALIVGLVTALFVIELRRRVRAEAELALAARTDVLTGLGNRRHFDDRINYEWQRAVKSRAKLALLMIDVDHFKAFNDRYGHAAGDLALTQIAKCLEHRSRKPLDTAARYGGEEFVIILPDATPEGAMRLARSVKADLSAAAIPHLGSQTGYLTVSIGIAAGPASHFASQAELFEKADAALYSAKNGGRNRICSSRPGFDKAVNAA